MRWCEFSRECPVLAELTAARFAADQLVLLGSLRPDGSPRISAVEPDIAAGELMVGMIPRSVKALDLRRDPRTTVHSWPPDKEGRRGDIKLYGRAVEVTEAALKRAYEEAIFARTGWRPTEPYPCFAFDLESAGMVRFSDAGREVWSWQAGQELRRRFIERDEE
jgi:pyridoxamine 5'-phosphate oxidase-like protein